MRLLVLFILCFNGLLVAQIDSTGLPTTTEEIITYPLVQLNSKYRDINLSITPNGKNLYFMSGRGEAPWSSPRYTTYKGQEEFDGDIWFSKRVDTTWQKPSHLPKSVNTSRSEDEPNISADAQTVYFQSWKMGWERSGGPYYQAELYGEKWENPRGLFGGINRFFQDSLYKYDQYATDGMSISADQRTFIVAAGPYYDGEMDIYISRKDERNKWTYPKRLAISTDDDERSVFIAADNQTLYFGSKGHGGVGGMDIFKTTLHKDNTCGEIINIGAPFNTEKDDYGFIIGALGHDAYFVREGDIHYAKLGEKNGFLKPKPTQLLEGMVLDCDGKPTQANVELYSLSTNELLSTARSNSVTGAYSLALSKEAGKYMQRFKYADSKKTAVNKTFEIIEDGAAILYFEVRPDCLPAEPLALLPKSELKPEPIEVFVYFDFDKSNILAKEQAKLDSLIAVIKSNNRAGKVHIVGHTDSKGTNAYNLALSERRMKRVADYFIPKIVSKDTELDFKGETKPTATNDTAAERAKNRRVRIYWDAVE